ncbi:hypothetical protein [Nocardioides sp. Root151]|uniref:hypothetical protein n=1 Tax=Nocardioides sp. Root151 TaxID=1736475 RepID=UPI0007025D69|nr:hypothetical protein [Nocardioides sp. Root151]KQZ66339.1 hypothetical protein ASD66_22635 [Nocardioides sp. Root151]
MNTVRTPVLLMGWLSVVLLLDRADGGGGLWLQRGLGLGTWLVLVLALRWFTPLVRTQALVVVAFATVIEFVFSPTLEVYLYRFENVPAYVPPGHGLVYLSAWALGHTPFVRRHLTHASYAVVLVGGVWAGAGLAEGDALGFFWFLCLAGFLLWGPSREVYVGAFVVVSHLELLGTGLGNWAWQAHDPILGIGIGNPPSGAAGGYGWFDLVALLVAPWLLARFTRWRGTVVSPAGVRPPDARPGPRVSDGVT